MPEARAAGCAAIFLLASLWTRFAWSKCSFIAAIARSPWSRRTRSAARRTRSRSSRMNCVDDLLVRPPVERGEAGIGGQRLVKRRMEPDVLEPGCPVLGGNAVVTEIVQKAGQAGAGEA